MHPIMSRDFSCKHTQAAYRNWRENTYWDLFSFTVHICTHNIPQLIFDIFATFSKKALFSKRNPIDPSGENI